jgi:hypothetical protein
MNEDRILVTDIGSEVDRLFDNSSLPRDGTPKFVILMGGVAAKTGSGWTFLKRHSDPGFARPRFRYSADKKIGRQVNPVL